MNPDKYKVRITARLEREFATYRKQHGKSSGQYPAKLKKLALLGLAKGLKPGEVAAASKLTTKSIYNWSRCAAKPEAPSKLKLVRDRRVPARAEAMEPISYAKIKIGKDVTIEVRPSELSFELLQSLSQLGVSL